MTSSLISGLTLCHILKAKKAQVNVLKSVNQAAKEIPNLFEDGVVKVKELVIEPSKGISYQRHFKRSEIWFVSKGECVVKHGRDTDKPEEYDVVNLKTDEVIHIKVGDWHQIVNTSEEPCHIVEIQYGEETTEDDMERLEYYDGE